MTIVPRDERARPARASSPRSRRNPRAASLLLAAFFGLPLAGLAMVATAADAQAEIIDRIVAKVNRRVITQSDVIRMLPVYVQVVGMKPNALQTDAGRQELAMAVLQHLIDVELLVTDAKKRELMVTDEETERYIGQQRERLGLDDAGFRTALLRQGIRYDDFRDFMKGYLVRMRMLQLDVMARVDIPDDEVERAFQERYPGGPAEVYLTTSHLLISLPPDAAPESVETAVRIADEYRAEVLAGRPFEEIASENNADATRRTGGRIGTFRRGELDPAFEAEALNLAEGELSEPVRTRFGVHIIRLDRLERRPVEDAQRLRDQIHFELQQKEAERRERLYLERIRNEAFVQVVVDRVEL